MGHFALNHLVGDGIHPAQIAALIGQTGNLREYVAADIIYRAVHTSHVTFLHTAPDSRILFRRGF